MKTPNLSGCPGGTWFAAALLAGICTAATAADEPELMRLIDSPTAGLIPKGRFGLNLRLFPEGGVLGQLHAGAMKRLTIGLSYGGERLIGADKVKWYPRVETALRYRLIEENEALPAVVLGYETQGYGDFRNQRYQVKSKGAFVSFSKNYQSGLGQFGLHGGVNLTRENDDGDGDLSGWVGMDKRINEELSAVAEYDLAINDNSRNSLGSGKGYLNLGGHWSPVAYLSIGFLLRNVLENGARDLSRELSVRYTEEF